MTDENPDFTCSTCNETSTEGELLVCCDCCQRIFHSRCVNFNPADKKPGKKWYCPDKECQKKKRTKKSVEVPLPIPPELQEKLNAIEETRKRLEAEQEAERILKEKEMEMTRYIRERQRKIDEELREKAEEILKKDYEQREAAMAAETKMKKDHLERIQKLENTFRKKNISFDKLLKNSSTPLRNNEVKPLTEENVEIIRSRYVEKHDKKNLPIPLKSQDTSESDGTDSEPASKASGGGSGGGGGDDKKSAKSAKANKGEQKSDGLGQLGSGPTKAQRAARQGLTWKLPDFHGKLEEWPMFYAAYQASNEACGYTDVENLVRLQSCLKGRALEEVKGQLYLPKTVPRAIAKLRQLFGRPELLLRSHLQKVRKLEPPKADKLASYIPFGNAVEQHCDHIEAAELTAHLVNPILIQELVDKLPDGEKRNWIRYKRKKGDVNLRTLTNFLSKIVADACEANVSLDYRSDVTAAPESSGRSQHEEKGSIFHQSEAETSSERPKQKQPRPCRVCQRTDHRLWCCEDFKKLPYEDRAKMATKWKLCQRCLNEHGGQCLLKLRCNVGECREPHNPLLHPETRAVGMNAHMMATSPVLFRMLPVKVYCGERSLVVLAFLDEGSSLTLIESRLADRLGLLGTKEELTIKWTANITRVERHSRRTNLWTSAIDGTNGEKLLLQSVRTVEKLMPHQKLDGKEVSAHYEHLRELPVDSYDGRPGMLIGLNNIHSFAPMETKVGTTVDPVAVRCKLGWSVYGPRDAECAVTSSFLGCHQEVSNEELLDLRKSQHSLEETVATIPRELVDDHRSRTIMKDTTRRVENRCKTGWVWRTDDVKFPNNKPASKQLEKKLERSPKLYKSAKKQIKHQHAKGNKQKTTVKEQNDNINNNGSYFPLNVVVNPKKPEKVRLVRDAVAALEEEELNKIPVKGPDLPNERVFGEKINAQYFREADAAMTNEINRECADKMTSSTTTWSFIPPGTPHMGGAWERMVRSVKEALRALDDGRKLTDEILSTSLAETDDMINTRPLTYLPQESAERHHAITPNHFLRGTVTNADLKMDETVDAAAALRDVYKRSQQLADKMWERWSKEYLPTLNRRPKWFEDRKPIEAGDLVFVVDGKNRKNWARGRVEQVFRGSDGRVRQADVRTADGKVSKRAVANLAVLEILDGKSDVLEGPTDVTGWGVTTAKTAALPRGVTPTV